MKKLYSLGIIVLLTVSAWSQTRSWVGGSGNWNEVSNWSPMGLPTDEDILEFAGASATINNVPSTTFKGLIISGCDIILNAASGTTHTLTFGNSSSDLAININAGASLTIGNNLDVTLIENSFAAIDGVLIVATNRQYITNAGGLTRTAVSGSIINNGGKIVSEKTKLEFTDGSIYQHAMNGGAIPTATWAKNSTCNITGIVTNVPAGQDQVFGNYKWDCPNQTVAITGVNSLPSVITGNLVINSVGAGTDQTVYLQLPEKVSVGANFLLQSGACVSKGATASIDLAGSFIMSGGSI